MQLSVIQSEARLILNEPDASNSHFTNSQLTLWANEGVRFIATKLGVLPITKRQYTSASSITLNARFINLQEAFMLFSPENKYNRLEVVDLSFISEIDPSWLSADTGQPQYIFRTGTFTAALYPPPDTAHTGVAMQLYCLEAPTDLASDTDTADLPMNMHDILPHYVAYRGFQQLAQTDRSTAELIFVNGMVKAQLDKTTEFSPSRYRWVFTEADGA